MTKTTTMRAFWIAAAMGLSGEANAEFIPLPYVSGPGWISHASWSMVSVAPDPTPLFAPDPATTRAQLMWSAPAPGQPPRVTANFGTSYFALPEEPQPGDQYGGWIAADSTMVLYIVGEESFTYNLSEHMEDGVPVPIFIDITSALQERGSGHYDIWACDGGTVGAGLPLEGCHDDGDRWLFFDFEHGPNERPSFIAAELPEPGNSPMPVTPVPEPSSLSLLSLAALAGWRFRKHVLV
jgi:hypothetical protein